MKKTEQTKHQEADRTEVAMETWLSIVRAYNECAMTLAQKLVPFDISLLEHEVLMNLLMTPGLKQRQISERCFSAESGISMIIARFEKDGIVQRTRSKTDGRAWNLSLTGKGQELAESAMAIQVQVVLGMANPYSAQELLELKDKMDQSSNQMQKMRAKN